MITAIKSLFYIILAIAVLVILFFLGLILLVRGLLKKPLAEYEGKKTPAVFITTGIVFLCLPIVVIMGLAVTGISSSVKTLYDRAHYECVPDIWRKESVTQSNAEDEIIKALLLSADKGNRDTFSLNFTPELQKKKGFDKAVNDFFDAYPVGLYECKKTDKTRDTSDADDGNGDVKTGSLSFSCVLKEEWYFIDVRYCYRNAEEPDKVGVTGFRVMNLEAAAVYYNKEEAYSNAAAFPVCDIQSSASVSARLIGGRPYLWESSAASSVTGDQLRVLLKDGGRLDSPVLKTLLGEPGVVIKHSDSAEYGYFYEIAAKEGDPRYAYFQTDSESGNILWAFLCAPDRVNYDNPLYKDKSVTQW